MRIPVLLSFPSQLLGALEPCCPLSPEANVDKVKVAIDVEESRYADKPWLFDSWRESNAVYPVPLSRVLATLSLIHSSNAHPTSHKMAARVIQAYPLLQAAAGLLCLDPRLVLPETMFLKGRQGGPRA